MNKKILSVLAVPIALGAAFGTASYVAAQSHPNQSVNQADTQDNEKPDDSAQEAKESAALQAKAKVTSEQAKRIAENSAKGKAGSVELEDENGTVVYSVEVGSKEIKVDAATGNIVASDNETNEAGETDGDKEGAETPDTETKNH